MELHILVLASSAIAWHLTSDENTRNILNSENLHFIEKKKYYLWIRIRLLESSAQDAKNNGDMALFGSCTSSNFWSESYF